MRHNRLLAACLAAGLGLVAGCSAASSGGGATGSVTLTYLTFETPSLTASFWDTSIANAAKKVPGVTVKKLVAPSTDRDAYAKQLQASGQFPDLLLPLGNAYKGKVYIPPTNSQIIPMVFYNKTLFAKAGITAPPKTWSDFLTVCGKVKAAGIVPIELGGGDPFATSMPLVGILSADVLGKNPNWLQDRYAGKVKFADANVKTAVAKYRTLARNGYFEDGALGVKYADSITNFTSGKTAMYMMGSWFLGAVPKDHADDFGSFMTPTDGGSLVVPFAVGGSMAISAKTAAPDKATAFAQAWSLDPGNYKALIEGDGAFPMLKDKDLAGYNVNVTQVFKDSYAFVLNKNTKVSAFGWATNDDSMPSGLNDAFYAASQALFSSDDIAGQMTKLDAAWDSATK